MDTLDLLLHKHHRWLRKESKESFKVGRRLVEIIKSLMSSGAARSKSLASSGATR